MTILQEHESKIAEAANCVPKPWRYDDVGVLLSYRREELKR